MGNSETLYNLTTLEICSLEVLGISCIGLSEILLNWVPVWFETCNDQEVLSYDTFLSACMVPGFHLLGIFNAFEKPGFAQSKITNLLQSFLIQFQPCYCFATCFFFYILE